MNRVMDQLAKKSRLNDDVMGRMKLFSPLERIPTEIFNAWQKKCRKELGDLLNTTIYLEMSDNYPGVKTKWKNFNSKYDAEFNQVIPSKALHELFGADMDDYYDDPDVDIGRKGNPGIDNANDAFNLTFLIKSGDYTIGRNWAILAIEIVTDFYTVSNDIVPVKNALNALRLAIQATL